MPMLVLFAAAVATPAPAIAPSGHGDVALYRDIAREVRHGAGYYETAVRLQTERHYPTSPFYTVRPPTLAWVNALLGDTGLRVLGIIATLAVTLVWIRRLTGLAGRSIAGLAILGTSLPLALSPLVFVHDYWSGLLISAALALNGPKGRAVTGFAAVMIRELCFPFLWVLVVFERRRRYALAATALAAAGLALHAWMVPRGGISSPGWLGMRGPLAAVQDMVEMTPLLVLPPIIATILCVSPAFGWIRHRIGLVWFAGFWFLVAAFSRTDNPNWVLNLLPAWFVGWAFLAVAASKWVRERSRRRQAGLVTAEHQASSLSSGAWD